MKKTLVILALGVSAIASSYGQGNVFFNNGNTVKIATNSVTTATAGSTSTQLTMVNAGNNGYYYALLFSAAATTVNGSSSAIIGNNGNYVFSDLANWTLATTSGGAVLGTNTLSAGRFASNQADTGSVTQISNLGAGASAHFVIVGWSADIGNTFAAASAWWNAGQPTTGGWLGESNVSGLLTTGITGSTTTLTLMGTGASLINAFTIGQVIPTPEPATIALAGLGGLSLLALRRKK